MLRMRLAGPGCLVDGLQAHQHLRPVTSHSDAIPPQMADYLTAPVVRVVQKQLVDLAHQGQILCTLAPWAVCSTQRIGPNEAVGIDGSS